MRIGSRFDVACANITSVTGCKLPWVKSMRYLGVYIVSHRVFKCSLDNAKRAFYRSLNAIFGKIGRIASGEVTLPLVASKCMLPILLYAAEACQITKSDIRSLDFMINWFLMRLFRSSDMDLIGECITYFNFKMPSSLLSVKISRFTNRYKTCSNYLCNLFFEK